MARVLAVDDDATVLMVVQASLEAAGHTVVTTDHPQSAVELAVSVHVDAVILDVMMPEVNGYAVLRGIRHHPAVGKLPVLMLSALSDREDRVRGLKEGADDYLTKPFDPEELVLRIERLVERAEASTAHFQGSLEHFSIPELLQQLEQGNKTGTLHLDCGGLSGAVVIIDGKVMEASLEQLTGKNACFAVLEFSHGRFRFEPARPQELSTEEGGKGYSVQYLVLEHARLLDELYHHDAIEPGARMWALPEGGPMPRLPEDHPALPIAEVWAWIADRPGAPREELLGALVAAPRQLEAALAVLAQVGAIRTEEPVELDREMASIGDELSAAAQSDPLAAAVEAALRGAAACGIAPSLVPILLVVGQDAVTRVGELLDTLPDEDYVDLPERHSELLRSGRGLSVRLRQNVGTVVLNVMQMQDRRAQKRIEGILADCAAVIVWPRGESNDSDFEWIVPLVEKNETVRHGLFIAANASDNAALMPLIEGRRNWSLLGAEPATVAGLLRIIAEGLFTRA